MRKAKPGSLVVDNFDPVFLGIVSTRPEMGAAKAAIFRGQQALIDFLTASHGTLPAAQGIGQTLTSLELASSVHNLANALARVRLRSRGRQSA